MAESNKSSESPAVTPAASPVLPTSPTSVWARIKDHKIAQWALAYAAAAYTLLHGLEMLSEAQEWPHLIVRLASLVLLLGTPIACLLAWYHGARGLKRISGPELTILTVLLFIAGSLLWYFGREKAVADHAVATTATVVPAASIAVLPFADMSEKHDQAYFADGMAEEILNVLARVDGLKVASRSSSFQFRKRDDLGAPEMAAKLGVRHLLEGSVRKVGNTVRITAQLIDASTERHVWSESYDRPLTTANLFAIQDEIAKSIVTHLTSAIGGAATIVAPVARKGDTADEEAYDLYLKGRADFIARTRQNLRDAIAPLKAAVAKDPKFARAWEMLGAVLVTAKYWNVDKETDRRAGEEAIETALRLDPNLSLAHAVRGELQLDAIPTRGAAAWEDSNNSLARAMELDATDATAYSWRAQNYAALGYFDRAIADYRQCLKIDPAYDICRAHMAVTYLHLGRPDDAIRLLETSLENGYIYNNLIFLQALAPRGERVVLLITLAQAYEDTPQLIRPLFRALTDPAFSERDRRDAVALVRKAKTFNAPFAFLILKSYDDVTSAAGGQPIWWTRDSAWLMSQGRKRLMQSFCLPQYWRTHGFPPQCHPVGSDDFSCN